MAAKERIADDRGPDAQRVAESRPEAGWVDVKTEVARKLIEAMEKGETPWQKPWNSQAMRPRNPVTGNFYRGVNRILLSLAGGNGLFVTYQQARSMGWNVRKGEKGTMIVKAIDLDKEPANAGGAATEQPERSKAEGGEPTARRRIILKHYYVFAAHQIEGMPDLAPAGEPEFDPIEKAESIMAAMQAKTGLKVLYGKKEACYVPAMDEIHLPGKKSFRSAYDLASVQMHELGHSTLSDKRLARRDALGKRWGDEAYAAEELRAEIASAILSSELGIEMTESQREKHMTNHASYLQSWIKAIRNDPMAIFTAAKDAETMAEYILGIERQHTAMKDHAEWVADYDAAPQATR